METRQLGDADVQVSAICLGTMTWGRQNTEEEAFAQMDYAFDKGVNFFDTAELYPIPPEADTQGRTETMIGNWFEKTGTRQDVAHAKKGTTGIPKLPKWSSPAGHGSAPSLVCRLSCSDGSRSLKRS